MLFCWKILQYTTKAGHTSTGIGWAVGGNKHLQCEPVFTSNDVYLFPNSTPADVTRSRGN